tara:strand:- start:243 stop:461 length:219 start_codon:yes stop_codon:yes gene_type:complete
MSDSEPFDSKAEQFERLWDGITPKGVNRTKALKFRQKMYQHLLSVKHPQTKENARSYWMGELQQAIRLREGF